MTRRHTLRQCALKGDGGQHRHGDGPSWLSLGDASPGRQEEALLRVLQGVHAWLEHLLKALEPHPEGAGGAAVAGLPGAGTLRRRLIVVAHGAPFGSATSSG